MSELRELYQEVILDHGKKPRNFETLEPPCHHAEGYNPLCGDRVTVFVRTETKGNPDAEAIEKVTFQGAGCAICMASASLMTMVLPKMTVAEALTLFDRFHGMVTGADGAAEPEDLGKLVVLGGVREFPVRVKCATLPWHTLQAALKDRHETVTTE